MIIKGPVAGLLVDEVYTLRCLVIPHSVLLAVVRKLIYSTGNVRHRDVRQYSDRRSSKRSRWNYCVRKHALSNCGATWYVVRLILGNRIFQPLRQCLRPKCSVYAPRQRIAATVKKITCAEGAISLVHGGQLHKTGTRANHLARALIICEPEKLVLPKRPADGVAKLVLAQFRPAGIKIIAGVKLFIPQEFEN